MAITNDILPLKGNMEDLLRFGVQNGMIDISSIQEKIEMKRREEILSKHPYKIWQGTDGKWRTYLPDKEKGRVLKKISKKEDLLDIIVSFYKLQEEVEKPKTFRDAYFTWRKSHDLSLSNNSIQHYNTDYKRYFQGSDFESIPITKINSEIVSSFMITEVKDKSLCKKACKTLFGYIKNTILSARINHLITGNPVEFLEAKQYYKFCTEKPRSIEETVISDDTWKMLNAKIEEDKQKNPAYLPGYAVQFAMLTGCRVGEISALRWIDITKDYIIINKSEKYDRIRKEYYIDKTKNGKERIFPISKEIRKLLDDIKRVSEKGGFLSEWIFSDKEGRIHSQVISSCIKNKCGQLGIEKVGIHACRRTVNSKMRCNGVSSIVAASLLGHTEQVNDQYYTFDVTSIKEKADIVSLINSQIGNSCEQ